MDSVVRRLVGRSPRTTVGASLPSGPGSPEPAAPPFDVEVHLSPPFSLLRSGPR